MSRSDELKYLSCGREGMRDAATKIIIDLEANLSDAAADAAIFEERLSRTAQGCCCVIEGNKIVEYCKLHGDEKTDLQNRILRVQSGGNHYPECKFWGWDWTYSWDKTDCTCPLD